MADIKTFRLIVAIFCLIFIHLNKSVSSELLKNEILPGIIDEINILNILTKSNNYREIDLNIDFNKNGKQDLNDAIIILQFISGKYKIEHDNNSTKFIIKGRDNIWGDYDGIAEIHFLSNNELKVFHVQTYNEAFFEGDKIALAWEGSIIIDTPLILNVFLSQVGFIKSYKNFIRNENIDNEKILFKANFLKISQNEFYANFNSVDNNSNYAFEERWTINDNIEEIKWRNLRKKYKTHEKIQDNIKSSLFLTFSSFHALDQLKPYINKPEFNEAQHSWIIDYTNFDFYRTNPDIIRLIQKIPDHISIVEERIRNRAYRQKLIDKASEFDNIMSFLNDSPFINEYGMLVFENNAYDIDSLEWTGIYVASQALRYLSNYSNDAFLNMINSLKGLILCYEIAPIKGDFARTLRAHKDSVSGNWEQGLNEYQDIDWLKPSNNDMVKGFFVGFTFAYMALSKSETNNELINKMILIMKELLEHNDEIMDELKRPVNVLVGVAMLLMMDKVENIFDYEKIMDRIELAAKYEILFTSLEKYLIDLGNGSTYEYGISDWSGNQLNMEIFLVLHTIATFLEDDPLVLDSHLADYKQGMKNSLQNMKDTNIGFFQLVFATLSKSVENEYKNEIEDSIWLLRSFPCPKVYHNIDWRINPEFCMSPFPNLPWKFDWMETGVDRTRSLLSYPLFEQNVSNYHWKADPFVYKSIPGTIPHAADYLISYWFGVFYGVISKDM